MLVFMYEKMLTGERLLLRDARGTVRHVDGDLGLGCVQPLAI